MSTDTLIAIVAVLVSLVAAYFSWRAATQSNQLNRINSLVALRQHYSGLFRLDADMAEQYRSQPSAMKNIGESGATNAERVRVLDRALALHYQELVGDASAPNNSFKGMPLRGTP